MNIGDKLYKVNRDDRSNNLEKHNFLILELSAIMSLGRNKLVVFGYLDNIVLGPTDLLERMYRTEKEVITLSSRHRNNETVIVKANNLKEAAEKISTGLRNVYVQKQDAREEIIDLLRGQLTEMNRRRESVIESIKQINESLIELTNDDD